MTAQGAERSEDIPWPLTTLVGRDAEVAALVEQLQVQVQDPAVRLITLTGPGGVGKSRLALSVAEAARDSFDRVAFVPLATVRDPALILPAIARAFGIVEVAGGPLADRLAVALGRGKHLLLIDNFEQIIESGPVIGELLANAPGLHILVTSRALLRIQGEYAFPVPPLGLPPSAKSDKELSSRAAGRYGAVALFTQRARAADPSFRLTDRNVAAVVAICRRLDGLPLAIELAAARMRLLSASALLALLERRLAVLTGGPRDQPERLRTMRAAIAWSYDLLSPQEQILFRRLSVFDGGFGLGEAEAVVACRNDREPASEITSRAADWELGYSVLDEVTALAEQSLIRRGEWPGDVDPPHPRFTMLETIREFGLEQLAGSGEEPLVRRRHAQMFLALAERAEQDLAGPDERVWLEILEVDTQNIRAALAWTLDNDLDAAYRLGAALWLFWYRTGRVVEGEEWLGRALDRGQGVSSSARVKARFVWDTLAGTRGAFDVAVERLKQTVPLLTSGDDRVVEALAETSLGIYTLYGGRPAEALAPLERAQELYAHAATPMARTLGAFSQTQLIMALHLMGDDDGVAQRCEDIVAQLRASRSTAVTLPALSVLATISWNRGDVSRAGTVWQEALAWAWAAGERWLAIDPLYGLAAVAAERGTIRTALRLLGAVDRLCETTGITPLVAQAMTARIETAAAALPPGAILAERAAGATAPLAKIVTDVLRDTVELDSRSDRRPNLTRREQQVLRLLAEGRSDPEIAATLFVSRRTVATHVANLFRKLGVHSRAAASAYAVREGIA